MICNGSGEYIAVYYMERRFVPSLVIIVSILPWGGYF